MEPNPLRADRRKGAVRYTINGRRAFHNQGFIVNNVALGIKAKARGATDVEIRVQGGDWEPLEVWEARYGA